MKMKLFTISHSNFIKVNSRNIDLNNFLGYIWKPEAYYKNQIFKDVWTKERPGLLRQYVAEVALNQAHQDPKSYKAIEVRQAMTPVSPVQLTSVMNPPSSPVQVTPAMNPISSPVQVTPVMTSSSPVQMTPVMTSSSPVQMTPIMNPISSPVQMTPVMNPISSPVQMTPVMNPISPPVQVTPVMNPTSSPVQMTPVMNPTSSPVQMTPVMNPTSSPVQMTPVMNPTSSPVQMTPVMNPTSSPVQMTPVMNPTSSPVQMTPVMNPTSSPVQMTPVMNPTSSPVQMTPVMNPTSSPVQMTPVMNPTSSPVQMTPVMNPTSSPVQMTPVMNPTSSPVQMLQAMTHSTLSLSPSILVPHWLEEQTPQITSPAASKHVNRSIWSIESSRLSTESSTSSESTSSGRLSLPFEVVRPGSPYPDYQIRKSSIHTPHVSFHILDPRIVIFTKETSGVFKVLGSGASGSVYHARLLSSGHQLAVKLYHQAELVPHLIVNEGMIMALLQNTGVVPKFFGVLPEPGDIQKFTLVQEFFGDGMTLYKLIGMMNKHQITLNEKETITLCYRLVHALKVSYLNNLPVN
ncbi:uncharacterized threonine-rich GPI-anchored glycoprotein PJ4664.02-like isoform X1 [Mizuhopecten yessoensis]|uniref:uncharacterized threonine-rich GPI-anchored glycoprotein PJ4664.02-like isoform X1 n=1 Tax=Mizuhopecten yessoensis TaxID=6573 RepID=UPI000B459024|nr:uncharacterized threonine-rich GPI-anchored glycoprotein PJ4664.02-like isoform X1 [Mizuhopecten yessoensis]